MFHLGAESITSPDEILKLYNSNAYNNYTWISVNELKCEHKIKLVALQNNKL